MKNFSIEYFVNCVVNLTLQQRESAIFQLQDGAIKLLLHRSNIKHVQDDRLIGAQEVTTSNGSNKHVADLTGGTSDENSLGFL